MSAAPIRSSVSRRATLPEKLDLLDERMLLFDEDGLALETIRNVWLERGLCTRPADRSTAESSVAQLYRRSALPKPEFVWVPSPRAGSALIVTEGLSTKMSFDGTGLDCASGYVASMFSASRRRMDARIERRRIDWQIEHWQRERRSVGTVRDLPSDHSARRGISPQRIVRAAMWESLHTTLFDGVAAAIRTMLTPVAGAVTWYGQQEAHRIAYYDTFRRYGISTFDSEDRELLEVQTALADSTGWWWAFDNVCIMAERPTALHAEPIPGSAQGERRLHHSDSPAIEFEDGTNAFVLHGAIVPDWVVLDPTAERIAQERNVEIRRSAIERIGWDTYIEIAGLTLVDETDDPGNAGCLIQLYASPEGWGRSGRILLAVNGSLERDGHRRRYGLHVPGWFTSALDAAGWTYGITGSDYARLVRRT
ncbi:hypothetical protein R3Q06_08155 [Rhodococcus erythropolis]|uniref:DUF6745 domain-containing protein n=1 Tax=Rhodococcus erythropolis TaxID=1833 RepID=UPI00294A4D7A|nr:hypothetical protein [Rhodococcus erythropolis]MDV6273469.1 hypothetical protein [Rhodococcus erythropolis]